MKKMFISLFLFLCAGCTISSPLTTTEQWLQAQQQAEWQQAAKNMVVITNGQPQALNEAEIQEFAQKTSTAYGKITSFTVQKTEPLDDTVLKSLGVGEGFTVYYSLEADRTPPNWLNQYIIRVNGQWKIVFQN